MCTPAMIGPMRVACEAAQKVGGVAGDVKDAANFASDPLGSIGKACAQAEPWILEKLGAAVNATTQVDFTNSGFLRQ